MGRAIHALRCAWLARCAGRGDAESRGEGIGNPALNICLAIPGEIRERDEPGRASEPRGNLARDGKGKSRFPDPTGPGNGDQHLLPCRPEEERELASLVLATEEARP